MTKTKAPLVSNDKFDADGYPTTMRVGSLAWFDWLKDNRSFRYECSEGSFTACKESRKSGFFWYANRRVNGKLRRAYLGASEDLTLDHLVNVAIKLRGDDTQQETTKSYTKRECVTNKIESHSEELLRQLSELKQQNEQLRNQLAAYRERAKTIDLGTEKTYQLRGEPVIYVRTLEGLGYSVVRGSSPGLTSQHQADCESVL